MALVVEDGSIVAGANSYISVADARTYATARGLVLDASDAVVEAQLIVAMDFIESFRDKFQGDKVDTVTPQPLQWPRSEVYIDGVLFSSTAIPVELVQAQARLAVEQENGIELFPTDSGKFIVKEKTGPLETVYSEKIYGSPLPQMTAVTSLLSPLLDYAYRTSALRTVRI